MEIGSHKTKLGQDIILHCGLAVIFILLSNCSSPKPFQLTDVSPRYKEFQGTDLDPNKKNPTDVFVSNSQTYDAFFLKAHKAITSLEFAENVVIQAETKKSAGLEIKNEMNAAGYILEDLPPIVSDLKGLQKTNFELIDSAANDFDGPSLGKVSAELGRIQDSLNELEPKSEKIMQSIKNLRADSANYAESRAITGEKDNTIQEPKIDPVIIAETPALTPVEVEKKPIKKKQNSKVQINRLPKKNKVTGSAKDLFKEEIREVEDNLTDDERKENEYTDKIRSGLVEIFKWEYYKNSKNLETILLSHPIPRVRAAAALALGRIKSGRASLQKSIDKDGYQVRPAAYKALSDLGDKKSLSYFISGTKAEDIEVIAASYEGLGKTRDPAGREMIISTGLNSEYVLVVASSLRGLGYNKIPGDVTLIEKFLKSSEELEIKEAAIDSLSIHGSRESLRVLEENFKEQPQLAAKILYAIGNNPSLSATFSLIRLNESIEDEKFSQLIGEYLLRRKAFGKYAFILVEDDFLRKDPNERSKPVSYIKAREVGLVISETKQEFAVRMGEDILTDKYVQLKLESTIPGSRSQYINGWIFSPKIEMIEVKSLSDAKQGKYSNLKTGKHQNIFNPDEKTKKTIE
jgi:hypothetical protein